jgi:hypothetical protein
MKYRGFLTLLVVTLGSIAYAQSPNEQARFLAGLPVSDDKLAPLAATKWWGIHAASLDAAWERMDRRQLLGLRGWAESKIPDLHNSSAPVFYFFSGPDFLYAHAFFPNASTYILCGIEPVGSLPDVAALPAESVAAEIGGLRASLNTILKTHYFITKDMRVDLGRARLGGTLPVLYTFLARAGCTIRSVELQADHVRIDFRSSLGRKQSVHYYKTDLSNGANNQAFLKFCSGYAPGNSLVKSASYLMHSDRFSGAREFLLANSRALLQDDTGIPFRFFDPKLWQVRLHGSYFRHGDTFGKYDQPDLEAAFKSSGATPLGFSFGYHWQRERGLIIVARRK